MKEDFTVVGAPTLAEKGDLHGILYTPGTRRPKLIFNTGMALEDLAMDMVQFTRRSVIVERDTGKGLLYIIGSLGGDVLRGYYVHAFDPVLLENGDVIYLNC
tara:strand:- start:280 stop:585 length:306 start_codon:yes stop_codon:yes gene_type:complete